MTYAVSAMISLITKIHFVINTNTKIRVTIRNVSVSALLSSRRGSSSSWHTGITMRSHINDIYFEVYKCRLYRITFSTAPKQIPHRQHQHGLFLLFHGDSLKKWQPAYFLLVRKRTLVFTVSDIWWFPGQAMECRLVQDVCPPLYNWCDPEQDTVRRKQGSGWFILIK